MSAIALYVQCTCALATTAPTRSVPTPRSSAEPLVAVKAVRPVRPARGERERAAVPVHSTALRPTRSRQTQEVTKSTIAARNAG
ncbi:unnamed protein product [Lampetra fluviatilis]